MTLAVKRACDACHRRKVKCDGINPCRNCSAAQLSCTYNAIPQKKGPKGSRAKVISELRETQRQTSLSAKVQNRMNGIACAPTPLTLAPSPGLLTSELVKECSDFFFDNLYSQAPILDRRRIEQQVLYMEQNVDAYCLMTSMCAFIMLQPGMSMPSGDPYNLDMIPGANIVSSQLLLEECLRVRKGYDYLEVITLNSLATNFFLFGCYFGQEMHDKAWYHLREATTMIHMAGMHKEEYFMQFDAAEAARRRRFYWLIFTAERAYALKRQRPISLQATIELPTLEDDPTDLHAYQLNNLITLVSVFRPFDDALLANWIKTRGHFTSQYINGLQKQLNDLTRSYACGDPCHQDLATNQQWLENTIWQLTQGALNGNDDALSFNMTRELLVNMASQFPVQVLDLLGSGMIETLLEMSLSVIEYLAMQPASGDPFASSPRKHLKQIVSMISAARNGDFRFLPLLMNKMAEVLPCLTNPMLQNAPENAKLANMDIFDGYGSAGMAQPPGQLSMALDRDYDHKSSAEEYDRKYAMEMNSSPPESVTCSQQSQDSPSNGQQGSSDMGSSFMSSPGVVSPRTDLPHSTRGFYSEAMMSAINQARQSRNLQSGKHMTYDDMAQPMNGMTALKMQPHGTDAMSSLGGLDQLSHRQSQFSMQDQPHMGGLQTFQRTSSDATWLYLA